MCSKIASFCFRSIQWVRRHWYTQIHQTLTEHANSCKTLLVHRKLLNFNIIMIHELIFGCIERRFQYDIMASTSWIEAVESMDEHSETIDSVTVNAFALPNRCQLQIESFCMNFFFIFYNLPPAQHIGTYMQLNHLQSMRTDMYSSMRPKIRTVVDMLLDLSLF